MPDSVSLIRDVARAMGLNIPEERLPAIAAAIEAALRQADAIRTEPTPMPAPTMFDAAWSTKR